jgi:hypothetical protein
MLLLPCIRVRPGTGQIGAGITINPKSYFVRVNRARIEANPGCSMVL